MLEQFYAVSFGLYAALKSNEVKWSSGCCFEGQGLDVKAVNVLFSYSLQTA